MPKVWSEYLFDRSLGATSPVRGGAWSHGQCLAQLHQSWTGPGSVGAAQDARPATTSYRGLALEPSLAGGIYNLDYNPDGSVVVAACEQRNILLCDPRLQRVVNIVYKAHNDGVNCVRFLDQHTFATCSDDNTVALWDARYLDSRLRTLAGHSNWVKNIEFSAKDQLLLSSGFDGAVYLWDIKKCSESEPNHRKILYSNGLMRMKMSQGSERMVITTMNGYIMVIHDLDLHHLESDLYGFKANTYRLMQISGQMMPGAIEYSRLFQNKRNRIEFISDFPADNDAEIISSLEIHPQGWVAVTRNVSADEGSEWCCVHDIHSPAQESMSSLEDEQSRLPLDPSSPRIRGNASSRRSSSSGLFRLANYLASSNRLGSSNPPQRAGEGDDPNPESSANPMPVGEGTLAREITTDGDRPRIHIRSRAVAMESLQILQTLARRYEMAGEEAESSGNGESEVGGESDVPHRRRRRTRLLAEGSEDASGSSPNSNDLRAASSPSFEGANPMVIDVRSPYHHRVVRKVPLKEANIHLNLPRLTHYIQESHTGQGFIKEISFSPDGRVFCSPFGFGVRILAFDPKCQDLSDTIHEVESNGPRELHEVGLIKGHHSGSVLSCAFSPTQHILVTGCRNGQIAWHHPAL
ncbi:hypothetical protein TCAL_09583 [Tigriopus californicus]|uniref:Uncharacterized protein n=1 Tax=Tigriopus californicus TaxID=6832 RepID=A0A553PGT5_TIGCA|nr:DDB1- and CUL4-associated factor 10-like [Tigriopus californicus]TRY76891.1 hypothetical protein TCAL_09583 [Tigriopus californicus]